MTLALSIAYDSEAYFKRFQELRTYHIEIPADPAALGFNGMFALYSKLQEYKTRVVGILNDARSAKSNAKVQVKAAEYAYNAALDVLIDTDPEILVLPSDRTKVARANKKLKTQLETLHQAEIVYEHINAYYQTVEATMGDLESTNDNLREAINLFKKSLPQPNPAAVPGTGRIYTGL